MQIALLEFGRRMKKMTQNINCPGHLKMDKPKVIHSTLASVTTSLEYIAKVRNIINQNLLRISQTTTRLPGRTCENLAIQDTEG